MTRFSATTTAGLAGLILLFLTATAGAAGAGTLDDAQRVGAVGERFDGYLGLVDPAGPSRYANLVRDINDKRAQKYRQLARDQGIGVDQVARIVGAKLVSRAQPGEFVMRKEGRWERVLAPSPKSP